jgi:CHAT domain-containing protein/Tfp pilus assembly protein PilF
MNHWTPISRSRLCWLVVVLVAMSARLTPLRAAESDGRINEAQRLTDQMVQLRRAGKTAKAIVVWQKRLALVREIVGTEYNEAVADSLQVLADLHEENDDWKAAAKSLREVLVIRTKVLGSKHWKTTNARLALARLERLLRMEAGELRQLNQADRLQVQAFRADRKGEYKEASRLEQEALVILKQLFGDEHPEVARSLDHLGLFAQLQGDYGAAQQYYEQVLRQREHLLGPNHPDTGRALRSLAVVLDGTGNLEQGRSYHQRALSIFAETLGEDHPETTTARISLGSLLLTMGDYGGARTQYEYLLRIQKKAGAPPLELARSLDRLGLVYCKIGDLDKARDYYEQALGIYREVRGKNHPATAVGLMDVGSFYYGVRDYPKARSYFEEALAIRRSRLGKEHLDTAESLLMMGAVMGAQGDYKAARPYLEDAVKITRELPKKGVPETAAAASAAETLGFLLIRMGEYAAARPYLDEALEAWTRLSGEESAAGRCLHDLALVHASSEHWEEAVKVTDRARRLLRRQAGRALMGLAEHEQLNFLGFSHETALHQALSLGLVRRKDPSIAELSASWLINAKALAHQVLAERTLLVRDSSDEQIANLAKEWYAVRTELATLNLKRPGPGQEASHRQRLTRLSEREQALGSRLGQATGRPISDDPWIALDRVKNQLSEDAVLVEIAKVRVWNFQSRGPDSPWQAPRYVAWVIPAKGAVQVIDLGEADKIEAAIKAFRELIASAGTTIFQEGEADAEAKARQQLQIIAQQVLSPLEAWLGKTNRWFISADAALWLVPWAALPLKDGSYAIEKHTISYLVSGRDLAAAGYQDAKGTSVVMADPDFDLDPAQARTETERLLSKGLYVHRGTSRRSGATISTRWPRLFGTADEAKAIAPKIAAYLKSEPRVYTREQALESVFKASKTPRVVVLSTHAYFLEDQHPEQEDQQDWIEWDPRRPTRAIENPLLRCGLVLAGANKRDQLKEDALDDGILTGLEIVGTDLRGTELVILSACDTGVGKVQNGEGVAGLRQAFQLAGAKSVVSTLWKIPDDETVKLMTAFWENLAAGQNKAEALRNAQLALIKRHRAKEKAAHPYFWAAFTLTGQWQAKN